MPFVTDKLAFFHIPRTGGQWVRRAIKKHVPVFTAELMCRARLSRGAYHTARCSYEDDEILDRFSFTLVRDPAAWLSSWYTYVIGHPTWSGYPYSLLKMLSCRLSSWPNYFEDYLAAAGLPTAIPDIRMEEITKAMRHDKKILQGKIRFVLPRTIGEVFITDEVSPRLLEQVLVNWNEET